MDAEELSEDELREMEARCAAATPGPWRAWIEGRDMSAADSVITTGDDDIYLLPPPNRPAFRDLDFIAAARQDVPRLIAEVRRLRRLLREKEAREERSH